MARIAYTSKMLLSIRQSSKCIHLIRPIRRRLQYFKLYVRQITVIVSSRPPLNGSSTSIDNHVELYRKSAYRCLSDIHFENKLRTKRKETLPSMLLTNARSIFHKMDELRMHVSRTRPCIIAITESWLNDDVPDLAIHIDGYRIFRMDRGSRGGGILCYVRNSLTSEVFLDSMDDSSCKTEIMNILIKDYSLLLVVLYHPFWENNSADHVALTRLENILDTALLKFGDSLRLTVCGDFNGLRSSYPDIETMAGLSRTVHFPTRGMNVLDQVFVNFAQSDKATQLPPLSNSDHCIVWWKPSETSQPSFIRRRVRNFSKSRVARFHQQVSMIDWLSLVDGISDLGDSVAIFQNSLFTIFDSCFPRRTVRLRLSDPVWSKPSLKMLIDDRDKAFHKKQWPKYYRLRREVATHIKYLKQNFIRNYSSNPKDVWKTLRQVGGISRPDSSINFPVEDFNDYFASNFQPSGLALPLELPSQPVPIKLTSDEIRKELLRLRKKSPGPDGLPFWVFRFSADALCEAICSLFNRSFYQCSFPPAFKFANIRPVPKVSQPLSVDSFRPISLLCLLSKLLERFMLRKAILPCIKQKLGTNQFAYISRPGAGTVSALVATNHRILEFLDKSSGCVRILSIDFSKAFEKIPHSTILKACYKFGLSLPCIKWISSFLSDRVQRVMIEDKASSWSSITSGVPQGSVIGPVLFCMAIDDLSSSCSNTSVIKYADDVSFLHFLKDPSDDNLQREWDNLIDWPHNSGLPINTKKCHVTNITTKKDFQLSPVIMSNGSPVEERQSFTFLGVIFSSDLKWNLHFDFLYKKAMRRIFIIRNLRRSGCPQKLMVRAYIAFIRSVLLYAFPCVCNAPKFLLDKICRVERRVVRIMGTEVTPSLLSAADETCRKLFASVASFPQHPLREMFITNNGRRSVRTNRVLRKPFAKTKRFASSFIRYAM